MNLERYPNANYMVTDPLGHKRGENSRPLGLVQVETMENRALVGIPPTSRCMVSDQCGVLVCDCQEQQEKDECNFGLYDHWPVVWREE